MKPDTLITLILVYASLLMTCAGCESRSATVIYPNGIVVEYQRASLFTESSTDGLSFVRDGDDIALEIKPTGSKTDAAQLGTVVGAAIKAAN